MLRETGEPALDIVQVLEAARSAAAVEQKEAKEDTVIPLTKNQRHSDSAHTLTAYSVSPSLSNLLDLPEELSCDEATSNPENPAALNGLVIAASAAGEHSASPHEASKSKLSKSPSSSLRSSSSASDSSSNSEDEDSFSSAVSYSSSNKDSSSPSTPSPSKGLTSSLPLPEEAQEALSSTAESPQILALLCAGWVGRQVEVIGFGEAKQTMNGRRGIAESFDGTKKRFLVRLFPDGGDASDHSPLFSLKQANLKLVDVPALKSHLSQHLLVSHHQAGNSPRSSAGNFFANEGSAATDKVDWETRIDVTSGAEFYVHATTGEATWENPAQFEPQKPTASLSRPSTSPDRMRQKSEAPDEPYEVLLPHHGQDQPFHQDASDCHAPYASGGAEAMTYDWSQQSQHLYGERAPRQAQAKPSSAPFEQHTAFTIRESGDATKSVQPYPSVVYNQEQQQQYWPSYDGDMPLTAGSMLQGEGGEDAYSGQHSQPAYSYQNNYQNDDGERWVQQFDGASQAYFWVDSLTGETSWEYPGSAWHSRGNQESSTSYHLPAEADSGASYSTFRDPANESTMQVNGIRWAALVDPDSGHTYYLNESTGETSWEPPPKTAQAAGSFNIPRRSEATERHLAVGQAAVKALVRSRSILGQAASSGERKMPGSRENSNGDTGGKEAHRKVSFGSNATEASSRGDDQRLATGSMPANATAKSMSGPERRRPQSAVRDHAAAARLEY